tara:strand:- start:749 stop:988 length:240 start_codon:yes stop_codon:yes gene_type:complete
MNNYERINRFKLGDMVRDNSPHAWANAGVYGGGFRHGVIIQEQHTSRALNRMFKILWQNGTIGENVWDYDLKRVEDEDR